MELKVALTLVGVLLITDVAHSQQSALVNPQCECGISGDGVSTRIVGGYESVPHTFPWIVAIFNRGALHCGGTIINNRYILTAGHCVKWTDQRDLSVGLGMHDITNPREGVIAPIEKVILHPQFESDELHDTNDLAIIKLKKPIKFTRNIKPACLPTPGSDYTGHKVKVAGWGRVTMKGSEASKFLRQASLRVMDMRDCKKTSFGNHLTNEMMCAYRDDTDACQGDSGGPLLFERPDGKYEVVGVVSWGIGCAQKGMPGVYTKNTEYLNWMEASTRDAVYCMDS